MHEQSIITEFYTYNKETHNKPFESSILNKLVLSLALLDKEFREKFIKITGPLKAFIEEKEVQ
jgi:hypothetical protein